MKQKLIKGLVVIILIFLTSCSVIIWNLNEINSRERVAEQLSDMGNGYVDLIDEIQRSQAELYRRRAGLRPRSGRVGRALERFDTKLSRLLKKNAGYLGIMECNRCHSAQPKTKNVEQRFGELRLRFSDYKTTVRSLVLNQKIGSIDLDLLAKVSNDGESIVFSLGQLSHAAEAAATRLGSTFKASLVRSEYGIAFSILFGIFFFSATVLWMIRSITRPVDLLADAIRKVSRGDYSSRIETPADDEIGFLGRTFNAMTDELAALSAQKESLILKLQELNGSLEEKVREAAEQLKAAHERMLQTETLSAVGTFASGVAHELATPLSSVLSYFQMVKGLIPAGHAVAGDISLIEQELVRCRTVLRGMLDFARPSETDKSSVDINALISGMVALVKYQPAYRKIRVIEDFESGSPVILAVPAQLKQVFLNIIMNALQAMPEGGTLTVSTRAESNNHAPMQDLPASKEEDFIVVRVSDTGPGIPGEEIKKIFQPFYTTKGSGMGLGLAITYGIVRGHGGEIEVQSSRGKGTTFSVYLPVITHGDIPELKDLVHRSHSPSRLITKDGEIEDRIELRGEK